jgi:RimJ/RimL family protein N-acetyltransferase
VTEPDLRTLHPPTAGPLPDVTTDRLDLRRFRPGDEAVLAPVFAKPEVWRFPYGRGCTPEETATFVATQVAHWDACGLGCWLARDREGGRAVGFVGLSIPTFLPEVLPAVEVGWRFDPDVWGRGYATEGATAALHQAFTALGLGEVCSLPQADNPASVRVAERLGLRAVRTVTLPATDRRGAVEAVLFSVTATEWLDR